MKTEDKWVCPACGNELSGEVEFCPICMLGKPLDGETQIDESSAATTPPDTPHRFEHYELMRDHDGKPLELGRGAMGVTYKAFDVDLRCPVALKVINQKTSVTRLHSFGFCAKRGLRPRSDTRTLPLCST